MTSAAAVITAGFASSLRGIAWDVMAVIGCIVTGCTVLAVLLCLAATRGQGQPLRAPAQPSRVMPEIDGALPLFFRHVPTADEIGAEVDEWLQGDGRG